MKIEQVKAVVEIYRCAAFHGHSATPEQIHKLMLLSARIKRLTADGFANMSKRQRQAHQRAFKAATQAGHAVGAYEVWAGESYGLKLHWSKCPPTIL